MDATLCCDHCGSRTRLYRLIGTSDGLCVGCFVERHPAAPHLAGCLRDLRRPLRRAPRSVRRHRARS